MNLKTLTFLYFFGITIYASPLCNNIDNPDFNFFIAKTNKNLKLYTNEQRFLKKNILDCPKDSSDCEDNYSQPIKESTNIIISKILNGYYCSTNIFDNNNSGFISSNNLIILKNKKFNINNLIGKWEDAYKVSTIDIYKKNGNLNISGKSFWYGLIDENGERIIHVGAFESQLKTQVENKFFILTNDDCFINFNIIDNKYLLAKDNLSCGGMNVSFSGIYHKIAN